MEHYQGPRAQIDRSLYKKFMQEAILGQPGLTVWESPVEDLALEEVPPCEGPSITRFTCKGVILGMGLTVLYSCIILYLV